MALYDDAVEIIRELICIGYPIRAIKGLSDASYDGYDKEMIISLTSDGLWSEPLYREKNKWHDASYINDESSVAFIFDNCNSQVISHIKGEVSYVVEINDDECDGNCENCESHDSDITEDEETGFTTFSKSEAIGDGYSSISFSSTDPDLVKEFAKLYR